MSAWSRDKVWEGVVDGGQRASGRGGELVGLDRPGIGVSQRAGARFAVEDCRHVTRRLERDLLIAGCAVVRVPTHLMAASRRGGREPGKSDPIDALAVGHAALREPNLAVAQLDGPTREVKLLVDYRRDLVVQRTELVNRLRWHLHELDPGL